MLIVTHGRHWTAIARKPPTPCPVVTRPMTSRDPTLCHVLACCNWSGCGKVLSADTARWCSFVHWRSAGRPTRVRLLRHHSETVQRQELLLERHCCWRATLLSTIRYDFSVINSTFKFSFILWSLPIKIINGTNWSW